MDATSLLQSFGFEPTTESCDNVTVHDAVSFMRFLKAFGFKKEREAAYVVSNKKTDVVKPAFLDIMEVLPAKEDFDSDDDSDGEDLYAAWASDEVDEFTY